MMRSFVREPFAMLRHMTIFTAVLVLVWWIRDGDAHALKRNIQHFTAAKTHFSYDRGNSGSDWGSN